MAIAPALSFATFVFWLLAVPLDGPLIAALGVSDISHWFLPTHIVTLATIGCSPALFKRVPLSHLGIILTVILTIAIAFFPSVAHLLLPLLGISGAIVALCACLALRQAHQPVWHAALGLALANSALFLVTQASAINSWSVLLAALPLLLLVKKDCSIKPEAAHANELRRYLPLIFIYHVAGGLMYGFLLPAYQHTAIFPGLELGFYIVAVFGAAALTRLRSDAPLISGFLCAMLAFALLQWGAAINLSLYAMQTGAGFVDIFLLSFLLRQNQPVRAFALGMGTLCLGLFFGSLLGHQLALMPKGIVMSGNLVMNLCVLLLYLNGRITVPTRSTPSPCTEAIALPLPPVTEPTVAVTTHLPSNIRLLLSERECLVLSRCLTGQTYRLTALELAISESSVKTYMKRIYEKLEVSGRKELLERLASY